MILLVKILKDEDFDYMNTIIYFMSKKLDANKIFIFYSTIFFLGKIIYIIDDSTAEKRYK